MTTAEDTAYARLSADDGPAPAAVPYGPEPDQVVEVYGRPEDPVVVFVHGGYFRPAVDRSHARSTARALATTGRRVVLPEYRRVPGDPARTLADVVAVDAFVRETEGEVAGWLGHSAGGTLALVRALSAELPPTRVVGLGAVADLGRAEREGLGRDAVRDWRGDTPVAVLDPVALLRGHPDPAAVADRLLLVHGTDDVAVPVSQSEGLGVRRVLLPGAHHFDVVDPESRYWPDVLRVVDAHLGSPGQAG